MLHGVLKVHPEFQNYRNMCFKTNSPRQDSFWQQNLVSYEILISILSVFLYFFTSNFKFFLVFVDPLHLQKEVSPFLLLSFVKKFPFVKLFF